MNTTTIGFTFSLIAILLGLITLIRPWLLEKINYYFTQTEYVKVCYDNQFVIVRPGEELSFIDDGEDLAKYRFEMVHMTQYDFDSLPEFDGF